MTDTQKIAALEKQVASLKEQLNTEARQRSSDDAALAQRISVLESKR